MKKPTITLALALALCSGLHASPCTSNMDLIAFQDRSMIELIQHLEGKFNVRFNYESNLKHVKIKNDFQNNRIQKADLPNFIKDITFDQVEAEIVGQNAYILKVKAKPAQPRTGNAPSNARSTSALQQVVKGKIVDQETGAALQGVTVRIKGTEVAGQTDANGQFQLHSGETNPTLVITTLGYNRLEAVAGDNLTYSLTSSDQSIEEVVVTALGIKREQKALGYAVQDIKGDQLQKVKGVDVGTTLTGRIAGLRVNNSTEFNAMPTISLRGMSALLVIDGVAYENLNLRDVPVDNIANISVLKGSTAAALYGSKGAGGAIMITTKKGLNEKGTEINVNSNNMFFAGHLALPSVQSAYSAGEGGKYNTNDYVWGDKLDIGRKYEQWNPISKQMELAELTSRGKNNFQNFLEPGIISNNSVSFTNQGEYGSIRTSINHVYNKGQYPNQTLNMTNISVSGETKISEKISLESRFGYNRSFAPNDYGAGYGNQGFIYNILVWSGPEYDLSQYKDYWLVKNQKQNWHYNAWYDNPYLSAHEKLTSKLHNKLNAAVTLNYKFSDWGKVMLRSGYDNYGTTQEQTNPQGIYGTRGGFSGYHSNGKYWTRKLDGFATNNDLIFTANKTFGDFTIEGLAGAAVSYVRDNSIWASTVNGLAIPGFYSLNNSIDPTTTRESKTKNMLNSVYGRASLSWRNAIFVEATGRNDWSSALPKETRSFFYPSLSGSVILSDLLPDYKPSWLTMLKARGSWAVSKQVLDPYVINQAYNISSNAWDGLTMAGYPSTIKDYSISPTQRDLTEIGVDIAFLNNRIYANYTRYYRLLHNRSIETTISSGTGFNKRLINTAEQLMTKGHEITIGGAAIKKQDFQWDVVANLSQNLEFFHQLDPEYSADALYIKKGLRTDYYTVRDYERSPDGQIVHNSAGMPVSANYAAQLFGYSAPKWFWGLSNQFTYKDFGLSFSLDGRVGGLSYSNMNARLWQTGAHPDSDSKERYEEVVNGNKTFIGNGVRIVSGSVSYDKYGQVIKDDRVFAANDTKVSYENYWKSAYSGRQNIWDETFIKLREVSLNYYLPKETAERFKAKRASIGITGQNLFLWTKEYKFSDPDRGAEDLNSPSIRYVGFNLNLTF